MTKKTAFYLNKAALIAVYLFVPLLRIPVAFNGWRDDVADCYRDLHSELRRSFGAE